MTRSQCSSASTLFGVSTLFICIFVRIASLLPPHSEVLETPCFYVLRGVDVSQVEEERRLQKVLHPVQVQVAELIPLGHDHERVRALERVIFILGKKKLPADVLEPPGRFFHPSGVPNTQARPLRSQPFANRERRGLTHIVCIRLE